MTTSNKNNIDLQSSAGLILIPEHQNMKGNEKYDKCTVSGSLDETMVNNEFLTP